MLGFRKSEPAPWTSAIAIGLLLTGCSALEPPGQLVDLADTTWHVAAIAGSTIESDEFLVSFDGSMHVSVRTPCRSLTGIYQVDTDGNALSIDLSEIERNPCTTVQSADDARLISGIEATEYWSVGSDARISLHGTTQIDLARQTP